jgi:hypothetical protein
LSNEAAKAYGYKSENWTTSILADLIEARYDVRYKSRTSYYLLFKEDESVVILCEDEMILSSQTTFQKIWLPQGKYPKIEVSNTKVNRKFIFYLRNTTFNYAF